MKQYRVIKLLQRKPIIDSTDLKWAKELQEQFGLYAFDLEEIYLRWHYHSEELCASWLEPSPKEVEEVFNVILEEK